MRHQASLAVTLLVNHIQDPALVKSLRSPPSTSSSEVTEWLHAQVQLLLSELVSLQQNLTSHSPSRRLQSYGARHAPGSVRRSLRHLPFVQLCSSCACKLLPPVALQHNPSFFRMLSSCWGASRFQILAGPPYWGPPTGTDRATCSMPPTYPSAARQGPKLRPAPGPSYLGKREDKLCLRTPRPALPSARLPESLREASSTRSEPQFFKEATTSLERKTLLTCSLCSSPNPHNRT